MFHRRSAAPIGAGIGAMLLAIVAGCATAPVQQKETRLVWPPAPQTTRIQFVRAITSERDLTTDTTFTENLAAFLTGEKMPSGRIAEPAGIAVSDDGQRLYVSDMMQHAVFRFDFGVKKFTKFGEVGVPSGIALDAQENLYVADTVSKSIRAFSRDGKQVRDFSDPALHRPNGLAIDRARGRIYVVDTGGADGKEHNVKIYDLGGKRIGAIGSAPGGEFGRFNFPTYVAVDADGNVYVSDTMNSRVQKFDPEGNFVTSFGQLGTNWGEFDKPKGVAIDSFGNVYVADSGWSNVQIFNPKGQVLLFFGGRGPIPGMMKNPLAVAIDKSNRIYVGDYLNHRIGVYELVNTTGSDSFLNPPPKAAQAKK